MVKAQYISLWTVDTQNDSPVRFIALCDRPNDLTFGLSYRRSNSRQQLLCHDAKAHGKNLGTGMRVQHEDVMIPSGRAQVHSTALSGRDCQPPRLCIKSLRAPNIGNTKVDTAYGGYWKLAHDDLHFEQHLHCGGY
jgi:hypothetical protein